MPDTATDTEEVCDCRNLSHHVSSCYNNAAKKCLNCDRVFCYTCAEFHHKCETSGVATYDSLR